MEDKFDSEKKKENDFWDLSALLGKENDHGSFAPSYPDRKASVRARDIHLTPLSTSSAVVKEEKYRSSSLNVTDSVHGESFEYKPQNQPLIISVKLISMGKRDSIADSFSVYWEKYKDRVGEECAYVPMHDDAPVYTAFRDGALPYYFWWRACLKRDEYIKCDWAYISLRVAELINSPEETDPEATLLELWRLYAAYTNESSALYVSKALTALAEMICDYTLIHGLSVPDTVSDELIMRAARSARFHEIFFDSSHPECFMRLLAAHCSDHTVSCERYADQMKGIDSERYIHGALAYAVRKAKSEHMDHPLGMVFKERTTLQRTAFGGNVFVLPKNRYLIRIEFCSANRSYTLRNTVTGIVKHCENCLRAHVGVSARLKIYSLEPFFRDAVDEFFALSLPKRQRTRPQKAKEREAIPEYEKLYDAPAREEFSMERARKIEERSWALTERLISEMEEEQREEATSSVASERKAETEIPSEPVGDTLSGILNPSPQYRRFLFAVKEGDKAAWKEESVRLEKPSAVIADEINASSFDVLGDILIEESEDGFRIIEDYLYIFDEI